MEYCLDTNICVSAMREPGLGLSAVFLKHAPSDIAVPAMVRAELLYGAVKSNQPKRSIDKVERFLEPYTVLPFDKEAASIYASMRRGLEVRGMAIGPNDMVIAATALAYRLTLVTNNTREFMRVSGLRVEDWLRDAS